MTEGAMHDPADHRRSRTARDRASSGADDGLGPVPPGPVTVSCASSGCRTRVTVRGELDLDAGRYLRGRLHTALADSACGLDLDLTGLDFCDCAGLGVLLELRQRALGQGRTVTIRAAGPAVDRLLDLVGARKLFAAPHSCPATASRPGAAGLRPAVGRTPPGSLAAMGDRPRPVRASQGSVR
ncbi:STAS domain-containing protein [Streptomyces sp. NPDC059168]|uniref:STAS domain-containing protein n=1 Tax=Streptomyces sp. NPDC059168 TaxID=3346753 RepID=UPI00368BE807